MYQSKFGLVIRGNFRKSCMRLNYPHAKFSFLLYFVFRIFAKLFQCDGCNPFKWETSFVCIFYLFSSLFLLRIGFDPLTVSFSWYKDTFLNTYPYDFFVLFIFARLAVLFVRILASPRASPGVALSSPTPHRSSLPSLSFWLTAEQVFLFPSSDEMQKHVLWAMPHLSKTTSSPKTRPIPSLIHWSHSSENRG